MTIELNKLPQTIKKSKRRGRGIGSGKGKSAGRGTKGQKSRAGKKAPRGFEGGQTPLRQRLPKKRGYRKANKKLFSIINLGQIEEEFTAGDRVNQKSLVKMKLAKPNSLIKVLASGALTKKFSFSANLNYSRSAREKIKQAKGEIS